VLGCGVGLYAWACGAVFCGCGWGGLGRGGHACVGGRGVGVGGG
jgi:hypothetical protein